MVKSDSVADNSMDTQVLTFTQKLEAIDQVVQRIEGGDLTMEDLLNQYQQANNLIVQCENQLQNALQTITTLDDTTSAQSLRSAKDSGNT